MRTSMVMALAVLTSCADAESSLGETEDAVTGTCQTDIVASVGYRPPSVRFGTTTLAPGTLLPIPAKLAVTTGNAGDGIATLTVAEGSKVTTCAYRGGASVPHPTTVKDIAAGKSYDLVACTGGVHAGQSVATDYVLLVVEIGDIKDSSGETVVTMPILAPDGSACDDGDACTRIDSCQAGVCVGANPVSCGIGDACHEPGVCDPATGACSNPTAPDGTACNDGDACTQSDTCQAGVCTGTDPVACTAADACHAPGVCDPATGACSNPTAADGTTCNDGNACTQVDTCQLGVCIGADPVTCTADSGPSGVCDPGTGVCTNPITIDPTFHDFGLLHTFSDVSNFTFTVTNISDENQPDIEFFLSGGFDNDGDVFVADETCTAGLAAGASCQITVEYAPEEQDEFEDGFLVVESDNGFAEAEITGASTAIGGE